MLEQGVIPDPPHGILIPEMVPVSSGAIREDRGDRGEDKDTPPRAAVRDAGPGRRRFYPQIECEEM